MRTHLRILALIALCLSSLPSPAQDQPTFTKVTSGPIVENRGDNWSEAWGDFDNDGFIDLFVSNMGPFSNPGLTQTNFLYHNDANVPNGCLKVRLIGLVSNGFGIGAKIYVQATIRGREQRQLRQIHGGAGAANTGSLEAHFGLGDAVNVEVLRIKWPSGIVPVISTNRVGGGRWSRSITVSGSTLSSNRSLAPLRGAPNRAARSSPVPELCPRFVTELQDRLRAGPLLLLCPCQAMRHRRTAM